METIQFIQKTTDGKETPLKVMPIPLSILEQTQTLLEFNGRLPVHQPVKHYDFINTVGDILSQKYSIQQEPIWVTNAEAKRIPILDPEKKGIPVSWLFQRLVTRINIMDNSFNDAETNTSIAIGFTEKGIQVAFGQNVKICTNQCIFGDRYLSTYGKNKMPYDKMLEVIKEYAHSLSEIREKDLSILSDFRATPVDSNQVKALVGDVHLRAVRAAYFKQSSDDFPMNIGQVSSFSKSIGQRMPGIFEEESEPVFSDLYELYNDGTQIFKPAYSDISTLWENVNNWGEYIKGYKNLLN